MLLPLPLEARIPLAIASHVAVDMINEGGLGEHWVKEESILHAMLLMSGLLTGTVIFVIAGILLGNLIDILDKVVLMKITGKDDAIHTSRWYPSTVVNLTRANTYLINSLSVLMAGGLLWI